MNSIVKKDTKNKNEKTKETNKFINKMQSIYVPIHGKQLFDNLFANLNDNHLLNMINIYKNVVFEREHLIKKYIIKEKFINYNDHLFAAKIYVNAIQNYLYQ
tara:strand:- start:519 stop:824 length:306 start_codon:yes stop_codon:yes gene_type:complete